MFWEKFQYLAELKGMKPHAVLKELKISSGSANNWKKGTIPNGDALCKVADYFNCSVDYLLGRTDFPNMDKKEDISISKITIEITINGKRYELSEKWEAR